MPFVLALATRSKGILIFFVIIARGKRSFSMRSSLLASSLIFSSRSCQRSFFANGHYNRMSSSSSFHSELERLQSNPKEVFILDGGTGEELFRRGVPDDRKIWSATAVVNEKYHALLQKVHESFLESGSQAITTNSYGIVPGIGFNAKECAKYMDMAGRIARDAVSQQSTGFVFGSLGPLMESYRADLILPHEEGVKHYEIACQALSPYVDAYLAETMSCVAESKQAMEAVAKLAAQSKPMLVSYTLDSDGNFRDGMPVIKGLNQILEHKAKSNVELLAVMFNCAEPEAITMALSRIQADKGLTQRLHDSRLLLGAYANRLAAVDPNWTMAESEAPQPFRKDLDCGRYWNGFVKYWIDELGVQLVGGCCGITPEHIACIRSELKKR